MATSAQLKAAIDKFVDETSVRAFAIVNGLDNATVTTENGAVPTFAKAIKDFNDTNLARIVALETLVDSDDTNLDSIQEIVNALKALQTTLASDDTDFDTLQEFVDKMGTLDTAIAANTAKLTANNANVRSSGALMDDEVTNLAQVKAFDASDFETAGAAAAATGTLTPLPSGGQGRLATKMASETVVNPSILLVGDSLAGFLSNDFLAALESRFGGVQSLAGHTIDSRPSAGAANITGDFAVWPNGEYANLPTDGIVDFKYANNVGVEASEAKIFYLKESGAGTFKIQVSYNGAAFVDAVASVDADNATVLGATVTVPMQHGINIVRVVGLAGTVKIQQCRNYIVGAAGAGYANIEKGGISVNSMALTPVAVMSAALQDMAPDVIVWYMSDDTAEIEGGLVTFYANVNSALGYTPDWVFVSANSVTGDNRPIARAALRAFAKLKGHSFVDASAIVAPDLFVADDAFHQNDAGSRAISNHLLYAVEPMSSVPVKFNRISKPSSIVRRGTLGRAAIKNIGNILPLGAISSAAFDNGGTLSEAEGKFSQGGFLLNPGTAANGYARVNLAEGITSMPGAGRGIDFDFKMRFGLSFSGLVSSSSSGTFRFLIGSEGATPAAGGANALTEKGWGIEIMINSGNFSIRLISHDGTTYREGDWVILRAGSALQFRTFNVEFANDGAGLLSLVHKWGGEQPEITWTNSTLIGPTGYAPTANRFIDAVCVNPAASTSTKFSIGVYQTILELN